jgi:hypothetical protein
MQEKHKVQIGIIAAIAVLVWFFQIRNWGNMYGETQLLTISDLNAHWGTNFGLL